MESLLNHGFIQLMADELEANAAEKGDWKTYHPTAEEGFHTLRDAADQLAVALFQHQPKRVAECAANVANYAMKLGEEFGVLPEPEVSSPPEPPIKVMVDGECVAMFGRLDVPLESYGIYAGGGRFVSSQETAGRNVPPRDVSTTNPSPIKVCLCGSTRFYEAFQKANHEETMAGKIVLTVGFYPHSSEQAHGETIGITPKQKQDLDQLHFRKIEMADEVLILNVGGYIGESTRRELAHAQSLGKHVRFLEPLQVPA